MIARRSFFKAVGGGLLGGFALWKAKPQLAVTDVTSHGETVPQFITLTGIPTAPESVITRRLYRRNRDGSLRLIAVLPSGQNSFTDGGTR